MTPDVSPAAPVPPENPGRRTLFKIAGATLGAAAFAKAISPVFSWAASRSVDELLQTHYKELGPDDIKVILERLEQEALDEYGAEVNIRDLRPLDGVKYGYALNLSVCTGCRKCVEACHIENNHDRATYQSYIRVFEMDKGSIDFENGTVDYDETVPNPDKYYMPVQCQQCDDAPCIDVCPVEATWKEKDGVVVVDYNWCIGCRYCEAACPYHARRFNWTKPVIPSAEINPDQGYLSNRIRPQGVIEKCTFCLHRTRDGRLPACLEACPTGARVFGNLVDPQSPVRWVLANKRVFVLKEELGTKPSFFYFFDK